MIEYATANPIKGVDLEKFSTGADRLYDACKIFAQEFNVLDVLHDAFKLYVAMQSGGLDDAGQIAKLGCSKLPALSTVRVELVFVDYYETLKAHDPYQYRMMATQYSNTCIGNRALWPRDD